MRQAILTNFCILIRPFIMIVLKFGGTSVGNAVNIKKVAEIIRHTPGRKIVVLSAVSGTTNALVNINVSPIDQALIQVDQLERQYQLLISDLFATSGHFKKAASFIKNKFDALRELIKIPENDLEILAQGELISTQLFHFYLQEQTQDAGLIYALDFMSIDTNQEPQYPQIKNKLNALIGQHTVDTLITQGFICQNFKGEIDNLKRGGSDYTASIIGAAVGAEEIQIWTDINGMHNNDPRFVEKTFSIDELSFDEAAELAYFGAKILHPQSIIPAQQHGIPVRLKNTFNPTGNGTIIKNCSSSNGVRAIAAKDNIIVIKIKSYRMLMAYGFLKNIFEVFEKYQTPIDMITTSEVAVSVTIDDDQHLENILTELEVFGKVICQKKMSIICLAGNFSQETKGLTAAVTRCLADISIRMISYGGSDYNMSLLIAGVDKINALNLLNEGLFISKMTMAPTDY